MNNRYNGSRKLERRLPPQRSIPAVSTTRTNERGRRLRSHCRFSHSRNTPIRFAFVHGRAFGPALMAVEEARVIEAEQMQDRRVEVMYVQAIRDRVQTDFVGAADDLAALHAAAGHPHRE